MIRISFLLKLTRLGRQSISCIEITPELLLPQMEKLFFQQGQGQSHTTSVQFGSGEHPFKPRAWHLAAGLMERW